MISKKEIAISLAKLVVMFSFCTVGVAYAEDQSSTASKYDQNLDNVVFLSTTPDKVTFSDLVPFEPDLLDIKLRGGQKADSSLWPATVKTQHWNIYDKILESCTGAIVGPKVLLSAAHCIPSSNAISMVFRGSNYTGTCTKHPSYKGIGGTGTDLSADFALCVLDAKIEISTVRKFKYERIDLTAMEEHVTLPATSQKDIVLTGFGCTKDEVLKAALEMPGHVLRTGFNFFVDSSSDPNALFGEKLYGPYQRNNLFTALEPGLANVCPGDSGGPVFRPQKGDGKSLLRRSIVGVNSRAFTTHHAVTDPKRKYMESIISATGGPDFPSWAKNWAKQNGVKICGVYGRPRRCR